MERGKELAALRMAQQGTGLLRVDAVCKEGTCLKVVQ